MAYDETLAQRVRDIFKDQRVAFEEKKMMGGLCFMVNDKMCIGVEKERLMARIGPDAYDTALTRPGCRPMDFTGRPMRGFVFIQREGFKSDQDLNNWLALALAYNSIAPKSARKKVARPGKSNRKSSQRPTSPSG
jgi:hypothetical protein